MNEQSLKPRILVVQGGQTTSLHEIEPGQELKIGRHPQCPIVVQHPSVGRFHARIFCDASGVRIEDQNSANGTYVNEKRVEGAVTLHSGDIIRLGQVKNPDPIQLKFEDPSSQILDALAEHQSGASIDAKAASAVAVVAADAVSAAPPAVQAPIATSAEGEVAPAAQPAAPGLFHVLLQPVVWIPVGFVLIVATAVGFWFAFGLQKPWQSVRVEPVKIRAGWSVTLSGPEIEPSDTMKVLIQNQDASIQQMLPGKVIFNAPELGEGENGVRTVSLQVKRRGIVVFQQALQYEVVPDVRTVTPPEVPVGGVLVIAGTGFTTEIGRVDASLGPMKAPVLSATSREIQIRVPVLTRSGVVEVPLALRIGDWTAPQMMVRVRPRDSKCYPLTVTAEYVAEKVWGLRHALGFAFFVEGSAPSSGATSAGPLPAGVQQATQNLTSAFEKAGNDPTIQFEIRESTGGLALVAAGNSLSRPIEIGRWTRTVLSTVKARARFEGDSSLIPYWNVMVLNELLNLAGKAQAPSLLPAGSGMRDVLQKLYDRSVEAGGRGCPGPDEIQSLTPAERDQFQAACWAIPIDFGNIGGAWEGELANLGPSDSPDEVKRMLKLYLTQRGMSLSGSAVVEEVRPQGIRWSPPAIPWVKGHLSLGSQARIEITFPPNRPFGVTRLVGSFEGGAIEGTYTTENGMRGNCRLVRTVSD